jgi:hypothetical protein
MFFRFYILGILSCLLVLPTSLWSGGALILAWLISIPVKGISRYKNWKEHQGIFYPKSLPFCLKSMKRQKQNFRIINKLLRIEYSRIYFKRLSILLDDINVKFSNCCYKDSFKYNDYYLSPFIHSSAYDDCPENKYYSGE